jgi:hypothetical protein
MALLEECTPTGSLAGICVATLQGTAIWALGKWVFAQLVSGLSFLTALTTKIALQIRLTT